MAKKILYTINRREITPLRMLKIIIINWFFAKNILLEIAVPYSSILITSTLITVTIYLILQVILFPLFLPLTILIFWPLTLYLCRKKERSWLTWGAAYSLSALGVSILFIALVGNFDKSIEFLIFFILQSFGVGIFMYKDLYNASNSIVTKKIQNPISKN